MGKRIGEKIKVKMFSFKYIVFTEVRILRKSLNKVLINEVTFKKKAKKRESSKQSCSKQLVSIIKFFILIK